MERLTKRDTDGQAMMDCEKCEADWTGKHGKPMADCTALYCRNRLLDRLAEYEDTEETLRQLCRNCDLERLEKLAEATRTGGWWCCRARWDSGCLPCWTRISI